MSINDNIYQELQKEYDNLKNLDIGLTKQLYVKIVSNNNVDETFFYKLKNDKNIMKELNKIRNVILGFINTLKDNNPTIMNDIIKVKFYKLILGLTESNTSKLVKGFENSFKNILNLTPDYSGKLVNRIEFDDKIILKPAPDYSGKIVKGLETDFKKILKPEPDYSGKIVKNLESDLKKYNKKETVEFSKSRRELSSTGLSSTGLSSKGLSSTGLSSKGLSSTVLSSTGLSSTGLSKTEADIRMETKEEEGKNGKKISISSQQFIEAIEDILNSLDDISIRETITNKDGNKQETITCYSTDGTVQSCKNPIKTNIVPGVPAGSNVTALSNVTDVSNAPDSSTSSTTSNFPSAPTGATGATGATVPLLAAVPTTDSTYPTNYPQNIIKDLTPVIDNTDLSKNPMDVVKNDPTTQRIIQSVSTEIKEPIMIENLKKKLEQIVIKKQEINDVNIKRKYEILAEIIKQVLDRIFASNKNKKQ